MLSQNLKTLRKLKGFSQEELAIQLNVVRQTVSKWENGSSVPDAALLIRIAEVLDTSVNVLLGEEIPEGEENEIKKLAFKLGVLNEQLAIQNERRRKMWRALFIALGVIVLVSVMIHLVLLLRMQYLLNTASGDISISVVGGSDGPREIYVSKVFAPFPLIVTVIATAISVIGIYLTKKK